MQWYRNKSLLHFTNKFELLHVCLYRKNNRDIVTIRGKVKYLVNYDFFRKIVSKIRSTKWQGLLWSGEVGEKEQEPLYPPAQYIN